MKNHLGESDDSNFEIKNYKFNPLFKDKAKFQIIENKKEQKILEYIPKKKNNENAIPSMTDSKSTPNNTLGPIGAIPTLNKHKANSQHIQTINEKNRYLKQENDINIIRNNYKEKIALLEEDYNKKILKMEEKNNQLIENIKELYRNKINEIQNQMGQHLNKVNKQNLELLNEIRILRTNSISLQEHYEKINELNNKWEEKFKNYKKNYENKYKQISTKIDTEFPLDKIFMEINSSTSPDNLLKMIKLIELKNKIGYYTFLLNLQEKYNEDYEKFEETNKKEVKNLKKYAIKRFDDIIKDNKDVGDNNYGKKNTNNSQSKLDDKNYLKKSEIVNYDYSYLNDNNNKSGINNNINNINNIEGNQNNNLNISKSISYTQDKFSSDLESFNFNDDSIPNKDIQVLSPPDVIK